MFIKFFRAYPLNLIIWRVFLQKIAFLRSSFLCFSSSAFKVCLFYRYLQQTDEFIFLPQRKEVAEVYKYHGETKKKDAYRFRRFISLFKYVTFYIFSQLISAVRIFFSLTFIGYRER